MWLNKSRLSNYPRIVELLRHQEFEIENISTPVFRKPRKSRPKPYHYVLQVIHYMHFMSIAITFPRIMKFHMTYTFIYMNASGHGLLPGETKLLLETWNNIDFPSVKPNGIPLVAISQEIFQQSIVTISQAKLIWNKCLKWTDSPLPMSF